MTVIVEDLVAETRARIYRPGDDFDHRCREKILWAKSNGADLERVLDWWVERENAKFLDSPEGQAAFERMRAVVESVLQGLETKTLQN